MARSSIKVVLDQRTPLDLNDGRNNTNTKSGRQLLRRVIRQLEGVLGGVGTGSSHLHMQINGGQPIAAFGTVTIAAGGNAADTVSINGVALTAVSGAPAANQFDISGTATADVTSLCAAINLQTNNALIVKHVEACQFAGSVTLTSCVAGTQLYIGAHRFNAVATAGAVRGYGDFGISGNDAADATALTAAINTHPLLSHQCVAIATSNVVAIRQRRGTSNALGVFVTTGGSGCAITTQCVATTTALVSAIVEDVTGNAITLAESTAGARIVVSGARLTGGTGPSTGTNSRMIVGQAKQ